MTPCKLVSAAMSTKSAALIFLHGLGDSPAGWSSLQESLPRIQPSLANVEYVFPPAPTIALTINNGAAMPGWFDLYNWPIGVGSQDDRVGQLQAVRQVEDCVVQLQARGIPRSRIVLGGFSQGGAIALLAAYHDSQAAVAATTTTTTTTESKLPFAACVSLSGWMLLPDEFLNGDDATARKETPCFWAHGQYDDKVLFEQQKFGVELLSNNGVRVEHSQWPMGHESHPKEIEQLADFLDRILFRDNKDGSSAGEL
jgi:lysophospholipase-2